MGKYAVVFGDSHVLVNDGPYGRFVDVKHGSPGDDAEVVDADKIEHKKEVSFFFIYAHTNAAAQTFAASLAVNCKHTLHVYGDIEVDWPPLMGAYANPLDRDSLSEKTKAFLNKHEDTKLSRVTMFDEVL